MHSPSAEKGIGLMGGSFDPVHNGHLAICRSYLESSYIERLYVILTPDPPHKENRQLTDFNHRFKMLKMATCNMENLIVSDLEKNLPKPSYTVNTVLHFHKKYPEKDLYLCIGEDSFTQFTDWYHWEEILEHCTLLVAKRPETDHEDIPEKLKDNAYFVDHEEIAISSSQIRKQLKLGKDVSQYLPESVLKYINKNDLYREGTG